MMRPFQGCREPVTLFFTSMSAPWILKPHATAVTRPMSVVKMYNTCAMSSSMVARTQLLGGDASPSPLPPTINGLPYAPCLAPPPSFVTGMRQWRRDSRADSNPSVFRRAMHPFLSVSRSLSVFYPSHLFTSTKMLLPILIFLGSAPFQTH